MSNILIEKEVAFEKRMDLYMERLYKFYGFGIIWDGDRQKDLTLIKDGKKQLIEHKYRYFPDKVFDDILVEIMQDMISHNLGWIYVCGADYLHYIICKGERNDEYVSYYYNIKLHKFKIWLFDWLKIKQCPQYITSKKGYGITLNLAVPIKEIPKYLIKRLEYKQGDQI